MKLIRQSMAIGLAVAATVVAACSTSPKQAGSTPSGNPGDQASNPGDTTGNLSMQLTLLGGEHISKVTYTLSNTWTGEPVPQVAPFGSPVPPAIAGPDTLNGFYNISGTNTLSFVIGSVPAGQGYFLQLSATSDDGTVTCSYPDVGSSLGAEPPITVANRATTIANVNMQCVNNQGLDSGSVTVNATHSNCPVWNTIVANPYNITLDAGQNVNDSGALGATAIQGGASPAVASIQDGQSLVVVGSATVPDPSQLVFKWTASAGTFSDGLTTSPGALDMNNTPATSTSQTNQAIFTCPASGDIMVTISLDLTDGDAGNVCDPSFTHGTVTVHCTSLVPCAASGGIEATPNTAAGTCPTTPTPTVNAGTADGAGNFCCIPPPHCPMGPFANPFPGGTCTSPLVNDGTGCCVGLLPCTAAGQMNCVKCQGSTGGVCTATEALFVNLDINSTPPRATAPGNDPAGSCYACLLAGNCLNDPSTHISGTECGDMTGNFGGDGGGAGQTNTALCLATLGCITGATGMHCATNAQGQNYCYCGMGGGSPTACGTASGGAAANGACFMTEGNGFLFPPHDSSDILLNYTDTTEPSGFANQMVACALSNSCTQCL